jgi:hypothetical protein
MSGMNFDWNCLSAIRSPARSDATSGSYSYSAGHPVIDAPLFRGIALFGADAKVLLPCQYNFDLSPSAGF